MKHRRIVGILCLTALIIVGYHNLGGAKIGSSYSFWPWLLGTPYVLVFIFWTEYLVTILVKIIMIINIKKRNMLYAHVASIILMTVLALLCFSDFLLLLLFQSPMPITYKSSRSFEIVFVFVFSASVIIDAFDFYCLYLDQRQ